MDTKTKSLNISVRSFLAAILVIFALMVISYGLTFLIPGGAYTRTAEGTIDTSIAFARVKGGLPFWKWILSPVLALTVSGGGTLIAVIAFLLVIGGVFTCLDRCGLMRYMLNKTAHRFYTIRYRLMPVIILLFMSMGAMIGSFEECVPMVPIVVALSVSLGWDNTTGLGMSLLAAGCGFATGICNPFTVGVAQHLAGLPMFSGVWMRILSFILIFGLLSTFLYIHSKKVQSPVSPTAFEFTQNIALDRGLICFVFILGSGIAVVLCSGFITALQDYTMIIVAVTFLAAGISATLVSGTSFSTLGKSFVSGVVSMLPAVLMILMASSIRYTLEEAHILDTILHTAIILAQDLPGWAVVLFIYMLVLVINFFIPSGSAKAFMLIPLIVPMAQVFGISPQLCVLAFAFGDGFSNTFYPTNPALLISLGLADISYTRWFRWSGRFQLLNLVLTGLLLLLGYAIGY